MNADWYSNIYKLVFIYLYIYVIVSRLIFSFWYWNKFEVWIRECKLIIWYYNMFKKENITHLYHKIELCLFIIRDTKSSKSKISNNNFPWRTANMRVDWLKRKRIIPSIGETKISMSIDRFAIIDKTHVTKFHQYGLGFREEDSNSGA